MEIRIIKYIILSLGITVLLSSCTYDNKEDLYPFDKDACDLTNVTYSETIKPIMNTTCVSCHQESNPSGGLRVDSYEEIKKVVDNGRFWGSINHEVGFIPMPLEGSQLSDCNLLKIKKWIDDGSPNN